MVEQPDPRTGYAVKSYRYLRLAIVIAVLALVASVLVERVNATCWQGSFSAYYYTPSHSVFIGTLVVIGVCLIAIKAANDVEDMLLNVSGMLAPVVAFIPTKAPGTQCSEHPLTFDLTTRSAFVDNNILALAVGGGVALLVAAIVAVVTGKGSRITSTLQRVVSPIIGIALAGLLILAGVIWYLVDETSFLDNGHNAAAIAMFGIIWVDVVFNSVASWIAGKRTYAWSYTAIAAFMVVAAVAVFVAKQVASDWGHAVLAIEALEAGGFGAFWVAQTFENWDAGIIVSEARDRAAEKLHLA